MYSLSLDSAKIIEAFQKNVPGCYIRDYHKNGGYTTICRDYRDIKWKDQMDAGNVYSQVPATTLANLPRGNVTSAAIYSGLKLVRPGWRVEFRRAQRHLSETQRKNITEFLGVGEVFSGAE